MKSEVWTHDSVFIPIKDVVKAVDEEIIENIESGSDDVPEEPSPHRLTQRETMMHVEQRHALKYTHNNIMHYT